MKNKQGAALSALRRRVKHVCPVCEETFKGIKIARYCSTACQQRAKYRRANSR